MRYYSKGLEKLVTVFQVIIQVGGSVVNVTDLKTQMHMREWAKLIEACQDSGLSIKQWCLQNNLPESQYYYYLKKLRLEACKGLPSEKRDEPQFALVPNSSTVWSLLRRFPCDVSKICLCNAHHTSRKRLVLSGRPGGQRWATGF